VNDYGAMVRQLLMAVQPQPVGDVVPFGKRSMYPNPMTEMGPRSGGGGGRPGPVQDKVNQLVSDLMTNKGFSANAAKYEAAKMEQMGWPKGRYFWNPQTEAYEFRPE
jgi:hypothetical protein